MKLLFDVTAAEFQIIRDVLATHLGDECHVWVFGSRAKNTARFNSDLDLAIECAEALSKQALIRLNEAFDEAKLAFSVDVVDLNTVEPYFKTIIDSHKVVFPYPHPNPLPEREGAESATNYAVSSLSLGERARVREQNVPQLRFPEFSGEWEEKTLGEIATIKSGSTPLRSNHFFFDGGTINWVKTTDLNNTFIFDTEEKITSLVKARINPINTVLVAMYGGFNQIGRTGLLRVPAATNQAISVLNAYEDQVLPLYLLTWLNAKVDTWRMFAGSSRKDPNITGSDVAAFPIKFPSLPEQTKIASFLSAVDTKIDQLTQKKALLETYKKGAMQQIFSQQIRFKADDGREYPEWEEKKLGEVAQVNPKSKSLPEEFYYIDLESVEKGKLLKTVLIERIDAPSRAQRLLQEGDIVFQMVRPYQGNNYFFNLQGVFVASTGYAQIRTDQNSKYLYQFLHTEDFVTNVINRCTGSSYPAINSNDLADISVHLPCIEEQTKIANFLSAIDRKIDLVSQQLEQAKAFKKGLLQQMFV
jgi:type I restriction enzyme S subunit